MIKLKGSVTTIEQMDVEVTAQELAQQVQRNFATLEIVKMAYSKWLGTKGINSTDVRLSRNSSMGYYFQQYENHGGHYSGYYEVHGAYEEGDELIWEHFHNLITNLE